MRFSLVVNGPLVFALAACGSGNTPSDEATQEPARQQAPAEAARQANAVIAMADGKQVGTVTATEAPDGIRLVVNATGLPQGERGIHVHTVGLCEGPAFTSAGAHWNPGGNQHGLEAAGGPHAGDMPNLSIGADGTGTLEYTLAGATFAGLLDEDGSAFVIHAERDDQQTDPSGNSGDRVACGVFSEVTPAT